MGADLLFLWRLLSVMPHFTFSAVGWNIFAVNTTSGALTMDDAFALFYASLGGSHWPAVKDARTAHRQAVILPHLARVKAAHLSHPTATASSKVRVSRSEAGAALNKVTHLGRTSATLPSTTIKPEAGIVQVWTTPVMLSSLSPSTCSRPSADH